MKKIAVVGSTSYSEKIIYEFESTGFGEVVGLFDDFEEKDNQKYGKPILGKINDIPSFFKKGAFDLAVNTIGYLHRKFRKEVFEYLKSHQIPLATFIHPTAFVEKNVLVGDGSLISANCTVSMGVQLHENVILGTNTLICHGSKIFAHTFCGPSVNIAGNVEIGECCFLGINTTVVDNVKVGINVQTAAGSVITANTPSHVLMAGVPAVEKKKIPF